VEWCPKILTKGNSEDIVICKTNGVREWSTHEVQAFLTHLIPLGLLRQHHVLKTLEDERLSSLANVCVGKNELPRLTFEADLIGDMGTGPCRKEEFDASNVFHQCHGS